MPDATRSPGKRPWLAAAQAAFNARSARQRTASASQPPPPLQTPPPRQPPPPTQPTEPTEPATAAESQPPLRSRRASVPAGFGSSASATRASMPRPPPPPPPRRNAETDNDKKRSASREDGANAENAQPNVQHAQKLPPQTPCKSLAEMLKSGALSYYDALQVSPSAGEVEITKAFRRRAKTIHPDKNKAATANEDFIALTNVYTVLKTPRSRLAYNCRMQVSRSAHRARSASFSQPRTRTTASSDDDDVT